LGYSVKFEDINGDGSIDLLAGAPTMGGFPNNWGYVIAFRGPNTNPPVVLGTWTEPSPQSGLSSEYGFEVGSGDINGDGLKDVIVGRPYIQTPGAFPSPFSLISGKVYAESLGGVQPYGLNNPIQATWLPSSLPSSTGSIAVTGATPNSIVYGYVSNSPSTTGVTGGTVYIDPSSLTPSSPYVFTADASGTFSTQQFSYLDSSLAGNSFYIQFVEDQGGNYRFSNALKFTIVP
jgi:hypothetical protein